jgi:hypothetical protein
VLDLVSRCANAVDEGNWSYLAAKAGELFRRRGRVGSRRRGETARDAGTTDPRAVLAETLADGE